jgi:hypothetical protein
MISGRQADRQETDERMDSRLHPEQVTSTRIFFLLQSQSVESIICINVFDDVNHNLFR